MFDSSYICRAPICYTSEDGLSRVSKYQFLVEGTNGKTRYIVRIEHYADDICVIKFHRKRHQRDPKKYNLLAGYGQASKIIGTAINVGFSYLKKHPNVSFGFIGASRDKMGVNSEPEPLKETIRFRIYEDLIKALKIKNKELNSIFTIYSDKNTSTYLLVNNQNGDTEKYKHKIQTRVNDDYQLIFAESSQINLERH